MSTVRCPSHACVFPQPIATAMTAVALLARSGANVGAGSLVVSSTVFPEGRPVGTVAAHTNPRYTSLVGNPDAFDAKG